MTPKDHQRIDAILDSSGLRKKCPCCTQEVTGLIIEHNSGDDSTFGLVWVHSDKDDMRDMLRRRNDGDRLAIPLAVAENWACFVDVWDDVDAFQVWHTQHLLERA